jgi:hypothetical protein
MYLYVQINDYPACWCRCLRRCFHLIAFIIHRRPTSPFCVIHPSILLLLLRTETPPPPPDLWQRNQTSASAIQDSRRKTHDSEPAPPGVLVVGSVEPLRVHDQLRRALGHRGQVRDEQSVVVLRQEVRAEVRAGVRGGGGELLDQRRRVGFALSTTLLCSQLLCS